MSLCLSKKKKKDSNNAVNKRYAYKKLSGLSYTIVAQQTVALMIG